MKTESTLTANRSNPPKPRDAITTDSDDVKIEIATTINRTPEELFAFWQNFENLPLFMKHLESVEYEDDKHSIWRVRISEGNFTEWEVELTNERANELLEWRTLDYQHAGSIWFTAAPGGVGTEVTLGMEYSAGKFTEFMDKMFRRSPEQQMREDLRHFKQLMETGEIPTTAGQSAGRDSEVSVKYEESK